MPLLVYPFTPNTPNKIEGFLVVLIIIKFTADKQIPTTTYIDNKTLSDGILMSSFLQSVRNDSKWPLLLYIKPSIYWTGGIDDHINKGNEYR